MTSNDRCIECNGTGLFYPPDGSLPVNCACQEHRSSKPWVDEEGLRLFSEWLGMNYGKKVFGDHMEHHARRIFSHANSVIVSRRAADEPTDTEKQRDHWRKQCRDLQDILRNIGECISGHDGHVFDDVHALLEQSQAMRPVTKNCTQGHVAYSAGFDECPSCKIERERAAGETSAPPVECDCVDYCNGPDTTDRQCRAENGTF
jgi:hypothetical protein